MNKSSLKLSALTLAPLLLLAACGDSNSSKAPMVVEPPAPTPVDYSYQITVTNLTHAQPMSPVAVVLHNEGMLWQIGEPASAALELLAEAGDNTEVLAADIVLASQSGEGLLMPGMQESIDITLTDTMPMMFSVATMLVNTNDAFTGVNAYDISNLMVGESISFTARSYDAGTEFNTETAASIPGPASGGEGEGYNEARDDIADLVAMHPGVVGSEDGLTTSVLNAGHKFDNPTLSITIARTE